MMSVEDLRSRIDELESRISSLRLEVTDLKSKSSQALCVLFKRLERSDIPEDVRKLVVSYFDLCSLLSSSESSYSVLLQERFSLRDRLSMQLDSQVLELKKEILESLEHLDD